MRKLGIDILSLSFAIAVFLPGMPVLAKQAIVGGASINIKEAPWQVLLQFHGDGNIATCGASWLGGRWIVTAAHCTERILVDSVFVYAGITRRDQRNASTELRVKRVIRHPDYPIEWKDIALYELASDVTSVDARPIRPAGPRDAALRLIDPGRAVMATGWGGVNRGRDPADTLQRVMSKVNGATPYTITWAGFGEGDIGSCVGDSGGPLAVKDSTGTGWILAGVSSKIYSFCGDPASASSYTRVSAFHDWLQSVTGGVSTASSVPAIRFLPAKGGFHLESPQTLDLSFATFDGKTVGAIRAYYPAGINPLPVYPGATGPYLLRIRGENLNVVRRGR